MGTIRFCDDVSRWVQPPDAENRMSGGVGGMTGAIPLSPPDHVYLEFLSSLDDSDGQRALQKLTEPKTDQNTAWRGFNFFATTDQALLRAVLNPKFNIHGLRRADLKSYLPSLSDSSLSRQIKRPRVFGMIKRVPGTYRYYLTKLGRTATAACVHATEFTILPTLATTA